MICAQRKVFQFFPVDYEMLKRLITPTLKMTKTSEEIGGLLDALYLELLDLIEQQTACRVNIERLMNGGQLLLAKTRYLQGSQTICSAQIPTEDGKDFNALCSVQQQPSEDKVSGVAYELSKHAVNKEDGYVEPLHWFAILAPSSLRSAAEQFKTCLELVVESANLQRELVAVMNSIERLKKQQCTAAASAVVKS